MQTSANIATMPERVQYLRKMIKTIAHQFDVIRVCLNGFDEVPGWFSEYPNLIGAIPDVDLTDNGKFLPLTHLQEHEYFFTLDDDILYPEHYVGDTVTLIQTYGCIITYHGRLLRGMGLDYYRGHKFYSLVQPQDKVIEYDVCGTGVTAFDTRYFMPRGIALDHRQCMSDLLFSELAAMQGKKIGGATRPACWFKVMDVPGTIYERFARGNTAEQNRIADGIWKIKN